MKFNIEPSFKALLEDTKKQLTEYYNETILSNTIKHQTTKIESEIDMNTKSNNDEASLRKEFKFVINQYDRKKADKITRLNTIETVLLFKYLKEKKIIISEPRYLNTKDFINILTILTSYSDKGIEKYLIEDDKLVTDGTIKEEHIDNIISVLDEIKDIMTIIKNKL